jgi:hypothetical protein
MLMGLFRRGAVLWRWSDHARDLGAFGRSRAWRSQRPAFKPFVIPITLLVVAGLFAVQKRGTGSVGALFGPVMIAWFTTLALLGVIGILRAPQVLAAVNPLYAVRFLAMHGALGFFSLGAVVLVVTGAEALYADMGHFGSGPVRFAWTTLVLPALALNYFGQGALLIVDPEAVANPFYLLAPAWRSCPWWRSQQWQRSSHHRQSSPALFRLRNRRCNWAMHRVWTFSTRRATKSARSICGHQSDAFRRSGRAGTGVRIVDESRRRLRHRGHGHHGDHNRAGVRRRTADVALEPSRVRRNVRRVSAGRRRLLQR